MAVFWSIFHDSDGKIKVLLSKADP